MTARRLYTEDQIIAALNEASFKNGIFPATGTFLKELRGRGEPVLFTKDDLLAVAVTEHEKIVVHGIYAMLGTTAANDSALLAQAGTANMRSNMEIMIRLAKARKEEDFQPGQVVRDAAGIYYKMTGNGRWMTFEHAMFLDWDTPKRPLEKMP